MIFIDAQRDCDIPAITNLLNRAFPPGRTRKTSYRLREGREPVHELSFVVRDGARIVATNRFWQVLVRPDHDPANPIPVLLLGPLAVDPEYQGQNLGMALMRHGLDKAREMGFGAVILVGDPDYYARLDFAHEPAAGLRLPGPVEPRRFLAHEFASGLLAGVSGAVEPMPASLPERAPAVAGL